MNKSNILVTGGNGQLGSELKELASTYVNYHFIFTDVENLDICDHKAVTTFIDKNNINTIINCAAYTAVDKAEDQFELADKINHLAVANFAQIAKDKNIQLVHISTDYVFDGMNHKPYTETDTPNPQSVYGQTKLDGELAMQLINPQNSIIIRTSWVYSKFGNNFVKTMLRLGSERDQLNVVADQIGTPTHAADLAEAILTILPKIKNEAVEIFHYSNEGVCSWYDFAKAIFEIQGLPIKVKPTESAQYPTPAKRPFYSVLNKTNIKEKYQLEVPYWKNSLGCCLQLITSSIVKI
jgi:dTDP-4-dehydrorhamnose reductase